jgi:putative transposase
VLDRLLAGAGPGTALEREGPLDDLKALAERGLGAERDRRPAGEGPGDRRNGCGRKTVITGTGRIEPAVPRDRGPVSTRGRSPDAGAAFPSSTTGSSRCTPAA